ncbi:hypothetical protein [Pseudomonas avellanae]|uniref:hypothetical protein n=2 Tax=Pseudomonas TaxID=286 RepID=UPI00201B8942|nr:hypothetical protein [Pseudomonas avellanae]UQW77057.1 hypothetical protein L2Y01_27860 [Pseudomonas avellanae]
MTKLKSMFRLLRDRKNGRFAAAGCPVQPIYDSPEAGAIYDRLVQKWGLKEMRKAEKQLARHTDQLERQAREYVESRLKDRQATV